MFLALRTNPGYFDHRVIDRETEIVSFGQQAIVIALELGNLVTVATNQELRSAAMPGLDAGNERVPAFDPVDQAFAHQELERAVNNRRRDMLRASGLVQFGQNIVGAHRLMADQQSLEYLAAARGQAQLAFGTELGGFGQQLPLTAAMIMLAKSDFWGSGFARHSVIL
jgi:hypothetical protein